MKTYTLEMVEQTTDGKGKVILGLKGDGDTGLTRMPAFTKLVLASDALKLKGAMEKAFIKIHDARESPRISERMRLLDEVFCLLDTALNEVNE